MTAQEELESRLKQPEAECARLQEENTQLRERLSLPSDAPAQFTPADSTAFLVQAPPASEKIQLFQQLFRGREDVYPLRWENRKGKSGYSPVCANEWDRVLCGKPRVKCAQCQNRQFLPLTDTADLYRYFDCTQAAEFLYACVQRTVEHDLPKEIDYLRRLDEAMA